METGESILVEGQDSERNVPLGWTDVTPEMGQRTRELIASEPNLGKLKPIRVLEHLTPSTDSGIILFPGGLDQATDDEAMAIGQERSMSVFHLKYPADSSFSIRREVAQILDHTEARGIKKYHIVAGSWGGIPALNAVYNLLQEGTAEIESLFIVAAALQPSDLTTMVRELGSGIVYPALKLKSLALPGRQIASRISRGVPDFQYDDPVIRQKLACLPTVILVPPGGKDWWVDARRSQNKYFPNARVVEYPAYTNLVGKVRTLGGHSSEAAIGGIREIEKAAIDNPGLVPPVPSGFRLVR